MHRIHPDDVSHLFASTTGAATTPEPAPAPCPICEGYGFYTADVGIHDPDFGCVIPCTCRTTAIAQKTRDALLRASNLHTVRDKTFATFQPAALRDPTAFEFAVTYANNPFGWLVLLGPYGVGKSHLAAAIANQYVDQGGDALFWFVPNLLDSVRSTFNPDSPTSYQEQLARLQQVPLLVLDDFGTQNSTAWVLEKLYQIIHSRYDQSLPTVFTTNCAFDQIDGRIQSRMQDRALGTQIVIDGADYRRRPAHQRFCPPATVP